MSMGENERRPQYDYYLAGYKLQDSVCWKDMGVNIVLNLLPESCVRRNLKDTYGLMKNVRTSFKYIDKKMFSKLVKSYIRQKPKYAFQVWSPHLKHKELIEKVWRRATEMVPDQNS